MPASGSDPAVDAYIAAQPIASRPILARVRELIRRALPGAEERLSYQIPAYRRDGGMVIYFAGWKQHYSLYPATSRVVATFAAELEPYELSKGTIRFPLGAKIPATLIGKIAKLRAQEVAEAAAAKVARHAPKATAKRPPVKATAKAAPTKAASGPVKPAGKRAPAPSR